MPSRSAPRSQPPRGVGLASTLVVISIIVMLGFTVAGISFSHLSVSTKLSNAEVARNRAESVVAQAIDRVITDREAGNPDFQGVVNLPIGAGEPAGQGVVSFDQAQAGTLKIPYSTNNITPDVSALGVGGKVVPAHGIHVVGVGTCNGVERRIEAIVLIPKFAQSIASSGRITSNGGLKVAAVEDLSLLTSGGLASIPPDKIEPGDVACNSTNALQAMHLDGPDIHITGDARAVGGIDWDETQVVVDGMVKPNSDKSYLPKLDIASYDPEAAGKPGLTMVSGNQSNLVVDTWTKSNGNLYVSGGLKLDSGVLYVNGDLSVNGGISGNGAVIVTGRTEVFGGGAVTSDNLAAILSGGDLRLQATQADGAQYKGLIYTEGNFSADWVTLGGPAVANAPGGSEMSLNNVEMVYNEDATEIEIAVGQNAGGGTGGGGTGGTGGGGGTFPGAPPAWTGTPQSFTWTSVSSVSVDITVRPALTTQPPSFYYDSGTGQYALPSAQTLANQMEWQISLDGGATWTAPATYGNLESTMASALQAHLGPSWSAQDPTDLNQDMFVPVTIPMPPPFPPVTSPAHLTTWVNNSLQSAYAPAIQPTLDDANSYIASNPPPSTWGGGTPPPGPPPVPVDNIVITLNDSTFADLRDKMKVLYWGEPW